MMSIPLDAQVSTLCALAKRRLPDLHGSEASSPCNGDTPLQWGHHPYKETAAFRGSDPQAGRSLRCSAHSERRNTKRLLSADVARTRTSLAARPVPLAGGWARVFVELCTCRRSMADNLISIKFERMLTSRRLIPLYKAAANSPAWVSLGPLRSGLLSAVGITSSRNPHQTFG